MDMVPWFVVLTLLAQPFGVMPSGNMANALVPFSQSYMVPSSQGRTSLENYHLQGRVCEMRLEISPLTDSKATRLLLDNAKFDEHGYLTEMASYVPYETEPYLSGVFVNQYDDRQRLQQVTLTKPQPGEAEAQVDAQRIYNEQGRLSTVSATRTNPKSTVNVQATFDAGGRLLGQSVLGDGGVKLCATTYQYDAEGAVVVESTRNLAEGIAQRQWFNAQGFLTEWHEYNNNEKATKKLFIRYNDQNDPLRISDFAIVFDEQHWTRYAYDGYVYDAHGNWIERTMNSIEQRQGKEVRLPIAKQYRTLTYAKEVPTNNAG